MSKFALIVDETLEKVKSYGEIFNITVQNVFNRDVIKLDDFFYADSTKFVKSSTQDYSYYHSYRIRAGSDQVIILDERKHFYLSCSDSNDKSKFLELNQKRYNEFKKTCSVDSFADIQVIPLVDIVNKSLRKVLIKKWFYHNVVPTINKNIFEKKTTFSASTTNYPLTSSWGFIASYKPTILKHSRGCEKFYWIRFIKNDDNKIQLEENYGDEPLFFNKNSETYADLFTSDVSIANLARLVFDTDNDLGFVADLKPLVAELESQNFLGAL